MIETAHETAVLLLWALVLGAVPENGIVLWAYVWEIHDSYMYYGAKIPARMGKIFSRRIVR